MSDYGQRSEDRNQGYGRGDRAGRGGGPRRYDGAGREDRGDRGYREGRGDRGYRDRDYRDRGDRGYRDDRGHRGGGPRGHDDRGYRGDRDRDYRGRADRDYRGGSGSDRRGGPRGYDGRDGRGDRGDHRGGPRRYDDYRGRSRDSRGRDDYRGERRRYNDEPRDGLLADLVDHLHALDGRSYAAYKAIVGRYAAPEGWVLHVDRVQPDPYAPPTRIHVDVPADLPGLEVLAERALLETADRRLAVGDFLTRELRAGFGGTALSIAAPGQEILERSSVLLVPADMPDGGYGDDPTEAGSPDGAHAGEIGDPTEADDPGEAGVAPAGTTPGDPDAPETSGDPDAPGAGGAVGPLPASASDWTIEIRARMALPARGRSIQGHEASRIISRDLTREMAAALDLTGERAERLVAHVAALEDHRALSEVVRERGWVSFLADGSLLPRRSGVSDEPMRAGAVALRAPDSLAATVELPHAGRVRGTVVGPGVTLVVGGGYHGKSTLLNAIERGVYPHVPGDGRELVATAPDAVKVRAADGRAVTGVELTPFIAHLPGGRDTGAFATQNASGSTSQAASLMESIEAGASAILLDEDTSATNLLIRDARMRTLVAAEREPITPLVDRVGALAADLGVSTVLVMGGSGDYLDVADRVLLMDSYVLHDATESARAVAAAQPREATALAGFGEPTARVPLPAPARTRRGPVRTRAHGTTGLTLDREDVDVSDVAGIVDPGQAEAIAWALRALLEQRFDGESTLRTCLTDLEALLDDEGLDALQDVGARPAFLVRPRMVDVAAAVNRYRRLELA
ncbi:ABC-ATPase domain-containing protein [Actinomyces dentalis]|uniref:ABC-ATPase domain-containing protein n=1 Tax=Actinomyces dentalis TaxID=272548 RepID=UPI002356804E|nr:ABC-ATPase domain-containing protein [Actinomyces dentalis]